MIGHRSNRWLAIACRLTCLSAVILVAGIVTTSVGESWAMIVPLLIGFSVICFCLTCLPTRSGAMISLILLPWATIIGSDKIHFPLGASVLVYRESGSVALMVSIYSVVLGANLLCFWNAFAPSTYAVRRPVMWSAMVVSIAAIGSIHEGPSWLVISITVSLILALLDSGTEWPLDETSQLISGDSKRLVEEEGLTPQEKRPGG